MNSLPPRFVSPAIQPRAFLKFEEPSAARPLGDIVALMRSICEALRAHQEVIALTDDNGSRFGFLIGDAWLWTSGASLMHWHEFADDEMMAAGDLLVAEFKLEYENFSELCKMLASRDGRATIATMSVD